MEHLAQIKLRLLFNLFVLLTILFSLQISIVKAQDAGFEAGLAGQTANMTSNVIGTNMLNIGAAKIKAGRATTTFMHSPDVYEFVYNNYLTFDETHPKTKAGRMQLMLRLVKDFEAKMMQAGGYKLRDNADAANFASVLSYEAQYDKQQLTAAQLEIFRRYRQAAHQMLLNYPAYQGSADKFKEKMYILDAIMGEQAIEWREKARAARTNAEQQQAEQQTKRYAQYKMQLYTRENLRELERAGR